MNSKYFNSDQEDYMRMLDELKPEEKCACGWYYKGKCPACPPDQSLAESLKQRGAYGDEKT